MDKVYVFVRNRDEQIRMCRFLAERKFHWRSGSIASEIPAMLLMRTDSTQGIILVVDVEKSEITYFPAEVYNNANQLPGIIQDGCITVNDLIQNLL